MLVAATDPSDAYTTFTGITRLTRGETPGGVPLPPSHPLSRSLSVNPLRPARAASISVLPPSKDNTPIKSPRQHGSMDERSPRTAELPTPSRAYLGIPSDINLSVMRSATPPRKAPSPPGLTRLVIPSPPNPFPTTLKSTLAVTELMDDYFFPDSDWSLATGTQQRDLKDQITDYSSPARKELIEKTRYESPSRMAPSPSAYTRNGPTFGLGRSGSMVSNRNMGLARQDSTATMRMGEENWEMSKIRVKVSSNFAIADNRFAFLAIQELCLSLPLPLSTTF